MPKQIIALIELGASKTCGNVRNVRQVVVIPRAIRLELSVRTCGCWVSASSTAGRQAAKRARTPDPTDPSPAEIRSTYLVPSSGRYRRPGSFREAARRATCVRVHIRTYPRRILLVCRSCIKRGILPTPYVFLNLIIVFFSSLDSISLLTVWM